ncbi:hypothetical protein BDV19DRAFT_392229 [Aspergillus venezuelensis]
MPSFNIINGQIYTPGLAIINAPQPYTPLGGENLHISIDVSGSGRLPLEPESDAETEFHSLTLFLTSFETGKNFTIANGTETEIENSEDGDGYTSSILDLEPGSTVKHVNWVWPGCFVTDGQDDGNNDDDSARGSYNISMHQGFRLNGTEYYTVFHLPIEVSNAIEKDEERVECAGLENAFEPVVEGASNGSLPVQPWVGEGADSVVVDGDGEGLGYGLGLGGLGEGLRLRFGSISPPHIRRSSASSFNCSDPNL